MPRVKRERVFQVCVNGGKDGEWREAAGNRCLIEVQHDLAVGRFLGKTVRIQELYLGGAKKPRLTDDESITEAEMEN